jgi:hypothetical protein
MLPQRHSLARGDVCRADRRQLQHSLRGEAAVGRGEGCGASGMVPIFCTEYSRHSAL